MSKVVEAFKKVKNENSCLKDYMDDERFVEALELQKKLESLGFDKPKYWGTIMSREEAGRSPLERKR